MHQIIEKHHGVIDKFIGDGIMTVFLPREGLPSHELRAVRCAMEMIDALAQVTPTWESLGMGKAVVRVGIQSGEVVSGSIGAKRRRDYTVLGDPVNVASRLEGLAPDNGVLIGDTTYQKVADSIEVKVLEELQVKNRAEPVQPYLVVSAHKT